MNRVVVIDLGNSDAKFGLFRGDELINVTRIPTADLRGISTPEELPRSLREIIDGNPPVGLGSVVSWAGARLAAILSSAGCEVHPLTSLSPFGLSIDYEWGEPGVDRTAAAAAAFQRSGGPLLLVGAGTALHTNVVDAEGTYQGGAIMPGLRLMTQALGAGADQLTVIEPVKPERVIGKSTPECIEAGLYHCWIGGTLHLVRQTIEEMGGTPHVWLTGGQSRFLEPHLPDARIDPHLTLHGLTMALNRELAVR